MDTPYILSDDEKQLHANVSITAIREQSHVAHKRTFYTRLNQNGQRSLAAFWASCSYNDSSESVYAVGAYLYSDPTFITARESRYHGYGYINYPSATNWWVALYSPAFQMWWVNTDKISMTTTRHTNMVLHQLTTTRQKVKEVDRFQIRDMVTFGPTGYLRRLVSGREE